LIPYGRHQIDDDDIAAVVTALKSGWLTTGPAVPEFEADVASRVGAAHGVAVCNGTAALHCAAMALSLGEGDEVIVPAITFAATANAAVYAGATPVFADVRPDDLLIDPGTVEALITPNTRAVFAVDYAGQPCDWDVLREIADRHGLALVDDAAHALGATYRGRPVGTLADMTTFSFHPVKHITTGEGGMVVTDREDYVEKLRMLRNHGITRDFRERAQADSWEYEIDELGMNYRITDSQCALGSSQLARLDEWLDRRRAIAHHYDEAFADIAGVEPLAVAPDLEHAYHLYVIRLAEDIDRARVFSAMRAAGVGVNVHYLPVYLHPFYRREFGTTEGLCPVAEAAYESIISLPMFPSLTDSEVDFVIDVVRTAVDQERD